jgi:virulence-associated protein VapD
MYAMLFEFVFIDTYNAHDVKILMKSLGFERESLNFYITQSDNNALATLNIAVNKLAKIDWFKNSVRDIRAFKVDDWSDFTNIVKNGG